MLFRYQHIRSNNYLALLDNIAPNISISNNYPAVFDNKMMITIVSIIIIWKIITMKMIIIIIIITIINDNDKDER